MVTSAHLEAEAATVWSQEAVVSPRRGHADPLAPGSGSRGQADTWEVGSWPANCSGGGAQEGPVLRQSSLSAEVPGPNHIEQVFF